MEEHKDTKCLPKTKARIENQENISLLTNVLRKCGIYKQRNFTQPKRMKICHLQVNGYNWRKSS
jgi:hypothetical protein